MATVNALSIHNSNFSVKFGTREKLDSSTIPMFDVFNECPIKFSDIMFFVVGGAIGVGGNHAVEIKPNTRQWKHFMTNNNRMMPVLYILSKTEVTVETLLALNETNEVVPFKKSRICRVVEANCSDYSGIPEGYKMFVHSLNA